MSLKSGIDVVLHFLESIKVKTECNLLTKRVGHERDHEKLKLSPISYIRAWESYNHTPLKKKYIFENFDFWLSRYIYFRETNPQNIQSNSKIIKIWLLNYHNFFFFLFSMRVLKILSSITIADLLNYLKKSMFNFLFFLTNHIWTTLK